MICCCEILNDFELHEYVTDTLIFEHKKYYKRGQRIYFSKGKEAEEFLKKNPANIIPGYHLEVIKDFVCYAKHSDWQRQYITGDRIDFFTEEGRDNYHNTFKEQTRKIDYAHKDST